MKKMILSLVLIIVALSSTAVAQADDRAVTINQLPTKAQQFIKQYFPQNTVSYAKQDTDLFDGEFEVTFTDGNNVEFLKNGEWKNVECRNSAVPAAIVPQTIKDYVAKNHTNIKIIKIERDSREYEINLSDGRELKFDSKGKFVCYDY